MHCNDQNTLKEFKLLILWKLSLSWTFRPSVGLTRFVSLAKYFQILICIFLTKKIFKNPPFNWKSKGY